MIIVPTVGRRWIGERVRMTFDEDYEVDEVLAGEAAVTLIVDGHEKDTTRLEPGVFCRLTAGMTARWDVTAPLRKVFITG